MNENLATKWWTPVSLRGVVSFAWISLLITSLMCGISWMRGDDTGTSISLMVLIANSVIVWILPEDVPARPVPEKFGLFVVCGASMTVLSTNYLFHRSYQHWPYARGLLDGIPFIGCRSCCSRSRDQVIEMVHGQGNHE